MQQLEAVYSYRELVYSITWVGYVIDRKTCQQNISIVLISVPNFSESPVLQEFCGSIVRILSVRQVFTLHNPSTRSI